MIGDKLEQEHGEERFSNIVNSCIYGQPITITQFLRLLSNLRSRLNWQKVSELFVLGYRLLEIMTQVTTKPYEDERWSLFEKLWEFLVTTVARWVMENGGWVRQVILCIVCIRVSYTHFYVIIVLLTMQSDPPPPPPPMINSLKELCLWLSEVKVPLEWCALVCLNSDCAWSYAQSQHSDTAQN